MIFKKNNHGYSITELSIVLVLVCFLCTVTMGLFISLRKIVIGAEIESLQNACWYLQQRALATGEQQHIRFDEKNNNYVVGNIVEQLSSGITFGASKKMLGSPGNPVRAIQKPITFADNRMTFFPNGTISAGSVYLKTESEQNYAFTSSVAPIASFRMYRSNEKGWQRIDDL